jgi:hypothetical protein
MNSVFGWMSLLVSLLLLPPRARMPKQAHRSSSTVGSGLLVCVVQQQASPHAPTTKTSIELNKQDTFSSLAGGQAWGRLNTSDGGRLNTQRAAAAAIDPPTALRARQRLIQHT